ncbi:MAG: hypothetical protein AAF449_22050, partial [Myxococcota bacterium]
VEGAEQLGSAKVDSIDDLITAATALLQQIEQRHKRGRLAPILTEQVLVPIPARGFPQVGLPLHLPPGWLTADVPSPRLAPEERDRAEPRLSGDLWRIGRTLRALSAHLTDWPQDLKAVIDKLDAKSIGDRFGSTRTALIEVEALQSTQASEGASIEEPPLPSTSDRGDRGDTQIAGGPPGLPGLRPLKNAGSKDNATVRIELSAEDQKTLYGTDEAVTQLPEASRRKKGDGDTVIDKRSPWAMARAQTRVNTKPALTDDLPSGGPKIQNPEPFGAPDVDEATLQDVSLRTLAKGDDTPEGLSLSEAPSGRKKEAPTRRTVWDKADAVAPPPTKPVGPKGTVVGVRLINEPTGLRSGQSTDVPAMLPPPQIISPAGEHSTDLRAEPGMLPPPQVPVHPTPQILPGPQIGPTTGSPGSLGPSLPTGHPPGYGRVPTTPAAGPTSNPHILPGVSPGRQAPFTPAPFTPAPFPTQPGESRRAGPTTGSPVRSPYDGPTSSPSSRPGIGSPGIESPEIRSPSEPNRAGLGILYALIFFAAGGAVTFAAQTYLLTPGTTQNDVPPARTVQTIYPAGEILLQASPREASVISEQDGRVLGQTPMRFLVPANS